MRNTRKQMNRINAQHVKMHERHPESAHHKITLRGRRSPKAAPNSLAFLVNVEGVTEYDGRVRSANGMRWRVV